MGRAPRIKVRAARLSGSLLIVLAALLLIEVLRRFSNGEQPIGPAMMIMAAVNTGFNMVRLRLLASDRGKDINFKPSAIFTTNDSYVNAGIVLSGALVMWLKSNIPGLVVGFVVVAIAANGGKEILQEAGKKYASDQAIRIATT